MQLQIAFAVTIDVLLLGIGLLSLVFVFNNYKEISMNTLSEILCTLADTAYLGGK